MSEKNGKNANQNPSLVDDSLEKVEVDLRFLKADSVLVGTAFDPKGNKIKDANVPFTKRDIDKLLDKGITKLYYIPERKKESIKSTLPKINKNNTPDPAPVVVDENIKSKQKDLRKLIKETFEKIKKEEPINVPLLKDRLIELLTTLTSQKKFMIQLLKAHQSDFTSDRMFTHSVNVATLSMITALHLHLKEEAIIEVALAGLLHDIGVSKIKESILDKKEELTNDEILEIKKHPLYTVNILKSIEGISKSVLQICVQHHENIDGSGYPMKLKADKIFSLSQIVSIAEMYDALISDKPYLKGITPAKAILYIYMKSGKYYHKKIAISFIRTICEKMRITDIFPIESKIFLSTKEIAIIKGTSIHSLRPHIEIIKDSNHKPVRHPIPIDLSSDAQREIIRVLSLANGETTIKEAEILLKHFY